MDLKDVCIYTMTEFSILVSSPLFLSSLLLLFSFLSSVGLCILMTAKSF